MLITLTIIGVIAALTIPNLMQKYQDEALKTAYKKTYNILNNAYKTVFAENGHLECYYSTKNGKTGMYRSDCVIFYNEFFNTLKVAKRCKNNALQNGCLPDRGYKNAESVEIENGMAEEDANNSHGGCQQIKGNGIANNLSAVVLNDGQIIIYQNNWSIMWVDINGKKGPNKWGHDIFEFDIDYNFKLSLNKIVPVIDPGWTTCVLVEKGGRTPEEMYNKVILNK